MKLACSISRLPKTRLLSDSFWTRAWAVFGHNLFASIIIYVVALGIFFLVVALLAAVGGGSSP